MTHQSKSRNVIVTTLSSPHMNPIPPCPKGTPMQLTSFNGAKVVGVYQIMLDLEDYDRESPVRELLRDAYMRGSFATLLLEIEGSRSYAGHWIVKELTDPTLDELGDEEFKLCSYRLSGSDITVKGN